MIRSQHALDVWDYVVLGGLFLVSTAIGLYFAFKDRKRMGNTENYLMGGRTMHALPVAFSMTSGFVSAVTVIGTPAEIYVFGTTMSYTVITHYIIAIISAEIYIPLFYRLKLTSTYEYLEMRFNRAVRLLATTTFILNQVLYIAVTIYAPALGLNQVTGLDLWSSVFVTGGVCIVYTTMGGLKAVVWTDVFQVCVMWVGFIAILIRGSYLVGGFSKVWSTAYEGGRIDFVHFETDPRIRHTAWSILIGHSFMFSGMYGTTQTVIQRFLCCRTEKQAKIAVYLNSVGMTSLVGLACLVGITMYAYYAHCDPHTAGWVHASDQMGPYFVMDIFKDYPGLPGLYICSAFSGTLSTISSGINAMAAVALQDYVKPFIKLSPRVALWTSKILVVVFGSICLAVVALASNLGGIVEAAVGVNGMLLGPTLALFTMGWGCPWVNSHGAFAGLSLGVLSTVWVFIGKHIYGIPDKFLRRLNMKTTGCEFGNRSYTPATVFPATSSWESTTLEPELPSTERSGILDLYSLSYAYYPVLGFLVAILFGSAISFLTGRQNPEEISPGLTIAFFDHPFFRWLPERIRKPLRFGVRCDIDVKASMETNPQPLTLIASDDFVPEAKSARKNDSANQNNASEDNFKLLRKTIV